MQSQKLKYDLKKIIKEEHGTRIFDFASIKRKREIAFLCFLEPVACYILKILLEASIRNFKTESFCTKKFITSLIKNYFIQNITPMISKICVLEMHCAKKNNLLKGDTSKKRFNYFINSLSTKEIAISILNKYPELEINLADRLNCFVENIKILFMRMKKDKLIIQKILKNNFITNVVHIEWLGDSHCKGQCTALIIFGDHDNKRHKLIYKPRSLASDIAMQTYLNWFDSHTKTKLFYNCQIIDKKKYGWREFIEYKKCNSNDQIKKFYFRLGVLTTLIFSLSGRDIHASNIIAHGEYPILIDCECLAYVNPYISLKNPPNLISTLMLPFFIQPSEESPKYDLSAFSGGRAQYYPFKSEIWKNSGTDNMKLAEKFFKSKQNINLPSISNKKIDVFKFKTQFIDGFKFGFEFLINKKNILLSKNSPLKSFLNVKIRILFRNTPEYYNILHDSYHPVLLNDRNKRKKLILSLKNSFGKNECFQEIINHEIRDLSFSDIPYFYSISKNKSIYSSSDEKLNIKLIYSGYDLILFNLKKYFLPKNVNTYVRLINNSFYASALNSSNEKDIKNLFSLSYQNKLQKFLKIEKESMLLATSILDHLSSSFLEDEIDYYWPTLNVNNFGCWNADLSNESFYLGSTGIIFVFYLASKFLNDTGYFKLTENYINKIEVKINKISQSNEKLNIGVFDGLGGLLYFLGYIYQDRPSNKILSIIQKLLNIIQYKINENPNLDIISGLCGVIRVMLHIQTVCKSLELIDLLKKCVFHLSKKIENFFQSKQDKDSIFGFSHGFAGISWSLMHWLKFTEDENEYLSWTKMFSNLHTPISGQRSQFTWCNGITGYMLAKLDLLKIDKNKYLEKNIISQINEINTKGFSSKSICLCHGHMGNLDVLLEASKYNNQFFPLYYQRANQLTELIKKTKSNPLFLATPGLMTGTAGVAYELLRIAHPYSIPSVLMLGIY